MTAWNEQHMVWRLRVDVLKRYYILVLIDNFTRYLAGCNLAEQAVLHTASSKLFFLSVSAIRSRSSCNFCWFSSYLCCCSRSLNLLLCGFFCLFPRCSSMLFAIRRQI